MSKAVLISIRPEWCELIVNGKKTIEVRKSRPKLETPFKCYIYCTKAPKGWLRVDKMIQLDTKVIGEFVRDTFVTDRTFGHDPLFNGAACMSEIDASAYSCQSSIYGWHISDLKIYDKPKELSEFRVPCAEYERDNPRCGNCKYYYSESNEAIGFYDECCCDGLKYLEKPPQSWCYVEEDV